MVAELLVFDTIACMSHELPQIVPPEAISPITLEHPIHHLTGRYARVYQLSRLTQQIKEYMESSEKPFGEARFIRLVNEHDRLQRASNKNGDQIFTGNRVDTALTTTVAEVHLQ